MRNNGGGMGDEKKYAEKDFVCAYDFVLLFYYGKKKLLDIKSKKF